MGTLATVRDRFLKASGRFDLGTVGGEDKGANQFINSAQRFLDRTQKTPHSTLRFQTDYVAGQGSFEIQDLISPEDVHISTVTGMQKIYFKEYEYLFNIFNPDNLEQRGLPLYYSLATTGLSPELADLNLTTYEEQFTRHFQDITFGNFWQTKKLILRPIPDSSGTLIVRGRFFSPLLINDEDRSYWTELGEDALLTGSLMFLEVSMRNQTAANFYRTQLAGDLNAIDNELVWLSTCDRPVRING